MMSTDGNDDNTSPGSNNQRAPGYKRGYVACDSCRTRKVRCVLGSKPPCAKCLREHRDCVFQPQKKTARHREVPNWAQGQSTTSKSTAPISPASSIQQQTHEQTSTTAAYQSFPIDRSSGPRQRIDNTPSAVSSRSDHQTAGDGAVPNNDATIPDRVMTMYLTKPSDALGVLFDAAQPSLTQGRPRESRPSQPRLSKTQPQTSRYCNDNTSRIVAESGLVAISDLSPASEEVLDLWDRFRFVRQGWFTAQEGVTYLDLLYKYIAPLSPVLRDSYYDHETHRRLIVEEPLLCCTLLMISSRFFILPGAGGISRSHSIHQRLWQYCELLIQRIMLGQEKLSTAKTRVLASIESLILISDWHPRALLLPPELDGWDGELISPGYDRHNRVHTDDDAPLIRWREDVFEPTKRSERMSWMLLGAAVNLAYELGVLGDTANSFTSDNPVQTVRSHRIGKLLYVYVTQMSVDLGFSSLLPENITLKASAVLPASAQALQDRQWEAFMKLWVELTRLKKTASAMFFQSTAHTEQQLQSGHYCLLLEHFEPSLLRWQEDFEALSSDIPDALKSPMLIEYHYLKTYTSALSVQAVVDRAVARNVQRYGDLAGEGLQSCILPQDYKFMANVMTESTKVLEIATDMAAVGRLRFAPHRTLLCIATSSVFLLKAISLGARNADLQTSLDALDRCISAMRASGTDDMDFSLRYATLLERHVARFRENFFSPSRHDLAQAPTSGATATPAGLVCNNSASTHQSHTYLNTSDLSFGANLGGTDDHQMGDFGISSDDDWWARPFDPNIAPFRSNGEGLSLRLEPDSLDFLWNMPMPGGE